MKLCSPYLNTDELQFGFKKGLGCANAIFVLSETVEYFLTRGSSVFAAALDIKKAFDRVSHHKMFTSLIRAGLPKIVLLLLADWYTKLVIAVRWNGVLSREILVHSGVRQGSSFSPALFNVFINVFLVKLRLNNSGCKINGFFVGAIMFADDLLLLSATVDGLQRMLNCCNDLSVQLRLEFNCKKSLCCCIGPSSKHNISPMNLGTEQINWSSTFDYLGISFISGYKLTVNINKLKQKFFAACNCILGNTKSLNDILKLNLMESYCLPLLMYCIAALKLSVEQVCHGQ